VNDPDWIPIVGAASVHFQYRHPVNDRHVFLAREADGWLAWTHHRDCPGRSEERRLAYPRNHTHDVAEAAIEWAKGL
jgi:hypothetical protein